LTGTLDDKLNALHRGHFQLPLLAGGAHDELYFCMLFFRPAFFLSITSGAGNQMGNASSRAGFSIIVGATVTRFEQASSPVGPECLVHFIETGSQILQPRLPFNVHTRFLDEREA
jgi:hypothetical protein